MVRLATICCPSRSRPFNRYSYLYKVRVTIRNPIFASPFFELQVLAVVVFAFVLFVPRIQRKKYILVTN